MLTDVFPKACKRFFVNVFKYFLLFYFISESSASICSCHNGFFSARTSFFRYLFISRHFSEPVGHMFYNDSENSPADCMVFLIFQVGTDQAALLDCNLAQAILPVFKASRNRFTAGGNTSYFFQMTFPAWLNCLSNGRKVSRLSPDTFSKPSKPMA